MFNKVDSQRMDLLKDFKPTSKVQLRQFCIWYCQGDVKKATELYDFYAQGVDLPDNDPVQPTKMQVVKESVTDVLSFVKDNQDDIGNLIGLAKTLFGKGTATSAVADALPKIN